MRGGGQRRAAARRGVRAHVRRAAARSLPCCPGPGGAQRAAAGRCCAVGAAALRGPQHRCPAVARRLLCRAGPHGLGAQGPRGRLPQRCSCAPARVPSAGCAAGLLVLGPLWRPPWGRQRAASAVRARARLCSGAWARCQRAPTLLYAALPQPHSPPPPSSPFFSMPACARRTRRACLASPRWRMRPSWQC